MVSVSRVRNTGAHYPIGVNVTPSFYPGDLLIAPPYIQDSRFAESVLLITERHPQGTQALCLNRSSGHTVNEIIRPLNLELKEDLVLYWGGPVMTNTVWMLHSADWAMDNTISIDSRWSMTSNMEMFNRIIDGHRPEQFRIMLGISSWAPNQLEQEFKGLNGWDSGSSWLVAKSPDPEGLFIYKPTRLWRHCCELSGNQAIESWL